MINNESANMNSSDKAAERDIIISCQNFLSVSRAQQTVDDHDRLYGSPDESRLIISEEQLTRNCLSCEHGVGKNLSTIMLMMQSAAGDLGSRTMLEYRRLIGEPVQRRCYKPRPSDNSKNIAQNDGEQK